MPKRPQTATRVKHDEADENVEGMEADERIKGGAEEVGADGEALVGDEVEPLIGGEGEEDGAEQCGEGDPEGGALCLCLAQGAGSAVDGPAAGEQADGGDDGKREDFARGRAAEALAEVEDVGDDEDDEEGALGEDEARDADGAARGTLAVGFGVGGGAGRKGGAHGASASRWGLELIVGVRNRRGA